MTTRITRLSVVLLTSSVLVLSSIATVQQLLLVTNNNNAAFARENCSETETETDGTLERVCSGGERRPGEGQLGGGGVHSICTAELSGEEEEEEVNCDTFTFSGGNGGVTSGEGPGGSGGSGTFTQDESIFTFSLRGGEGGRSSDGTAAGGGGGSRTCTVDESAEEPVAFCSVDVGGSGSKPQSEEAP